MVKPLIHHKGQLIIFHKISLSYFFLPRAWDKTEAAKLLVNLEEFGFDKALDALVASFAEDCFLLDIDLK